MRSVGQQHHHAPAGLVALDGALDPPAIGQDHDVARLRERHRRTRQRQGERDDWSWQGWETRHRTDLTLPPAAREAIHAPSPRVRSRGGAGGGGRRARAEPLAAGAGRGRRRVGARDRDRRHDPRRVGRDPARPPHPCVSPASLGSSSNSRSPIMPGPVSEHATSGGIDARDGAVNRPRRAAPEALRGSGPGCARSGARGRGRRRDSASRRARPTRSRPTRHHEG